jgi:hypothetical protein
MMKAKQRARNLLAEITDFELKLQQEEVKMRVEIGLDIYNSDRILYSWIVRTEILIPSEPGYLPSIYDEKPLESILELNDLQTLIYETKYALYTIKRINKGLYVLRCLDLATSCTKTILYGNKIIAMTAAVHTYEKKKFTK